MKKIINRRHVCRRAIEGFFEGQDYLAVETPLLVNVPGTEPHLDYFASTWLDHQQKSHPLFLRSSPELHLKRVLTQGLNKIYQLGPAFRNGGELSAWHHPEFTMLEWYEVGLGMEALMTQTEHLVRYCHRALKLAEETVVDLPDCFERISVTTAFKDFAGLELVDKDSQLASKAIAHGHHSVLSTDDFETAFFKIMLDSIEPQLKAKQAVFIYDYPASQCALAKVDGSIAKRFELYLNGVELANAFVELTDAAANRQRLIDSNSIRKSIGKQQVIPLDEEFLADISQGLKDCSGIALGFDRLVAVLLGHSSLDEVIPFRQGYDFEGNYQPSN